MARRNTSNKKTKLNYTNISLTVIFLIILLFGGVMVFQLFNQKRGVPVYSDRLDGIVKVEDSTLKEAENIVKQTNLVETIQMRVQGRVIYATTYVIKEANVQQVEKMFEGVFNPFSNEQLSAYDFQFLVAKKDEVVKEGEKPAFPYFGSKSAISDSKEIIWQKKYQYEFPDETNKEDKE